MPSAVLGRFIAGESYGIRYDAGDKLGYLKATVEYALESPELGAGFAEYLNELYEQRKEFVTFAEVAASKE